MNPRRSEWRHGILGQQTGEGAGLRVQQAPGPEERQETTGRREGRYAGKTTRSVFKSPSPAVTMHTQSDLKSLDNGTYVIGFAGQANSYHEVRRRNLSFVLPS